MCLLVYVPKELSISILASWLNIADVAKLDSAFCHSKFRTVFKEMAYSETTIYDYPQREEARFNWKHPLCELFTTWILNKQVGVTGVTIAQVFEEDHQQREAYLKRHGCRFTWISYDENRIPKTSHLWWRRVLQDLLRYCPNVVQLRSPSYFDEGARREICATWPMLTHLDLAFCRKIGYIHEFSVHFHSLTHLDAPGSFFMSDIEQLIGGNPNLTDLSFGDVFRNSYLDYIPQSASICRQLRSLRVFLRHSGVDTLSVIANNCPLIEVLQVFVNKPAFNSGLSAPLLTIASRGLLTKLNLHNVANVVISDVYLEVAKNCSQLKYLSVPASSLNDLALYALAQHCPQLELLSVSKCNVTAGALTAVVQSCVKLQELYIEHCDIERADLDELTALVPATLKLY